jgi:hypothetical protein
MFKEHDVDEQQNLFDASNWMSKRTQKELRESWAPVVNEHVYKKIDEQPFAVLYDPQYGAANFPVRKLVTLEIIQHMLDVSDEEMQGMYNFDYRVAYALGQRSLGEWPLAERTRYYFRERLYVHTMTHPEEVDIIFGQFKKLTEAMVINAGIAVDEQRIDSTMIMSNIKKSGRITLAYDVLVKSARKIPRGHQTETVQLVLSPTFKKEIIYKAKTSEAGSKLTMLLQYCQEIKTLLETLAANNAADELRILGRLLSEQAETCGDGELTARNGKQVSPKSMQSAHDEEATYRKKGNKKQSGYTVTLAETCSDENEVQFITDYAVTPNAASDVEILKDRLETISGADCQTLYADGGYYSHEITEQAEENGIAMQYTGMSGRKGLPDRLPIDDFEFNDGNDAVRRCPAGHEPTHNSGTSGYINAHFDKTVCENCPLYGTCPAKPQKKTAVVRYSKESVLAAKQRTETIAGFRANTSKRAAIEGTNSALKRKGMEKLRVRGGVKCRIVCGYKILAQNISRFVKLVNGFYDKVVHRNPRAHCVVLSTV